MFPKRHRLNSTQYELVRKKGKKIYNSYFRGHVVYNTDDSRFAVLVPKKIAKKRWKRNTLKRQISHILKKQIKHENIHLLVVVNKAIDSKNDLPSHISDFLKRLN